MGISIHGFSSNTFRSRISIIIAERFLFVNHSFSTLFRMPGKWFVLNKKQSLGVALATCRRKSYKLL